jgi:hypothetical protein
MEIEAELDALDAIDDKSDEKVKTISDNVVKLTDRAIEMEKLGNEIEKFQIQVREEQKERLLKHGIAMAGIVVSTGLTVWGVLASMEFEKKGTITTILGRGFTNRLLPKVLKD